MPNQDAILESVIQQIDLLARRIERAADVDRPAVLWETGMLLGVIREFIDRGHVPRTVFHELIEIQEDLIQQVVSLSQRGDSRPAEHD